MPGGKLGVLSACRRVALAVAALALLGTGTRAQDPADDPAQLKTQADILFKRLLVRPDDLQASFQFAEIETRLGDYAGRHRRVERMLFYNQNLPRVRLELGLLYFRLGSYAMARSYFEAAIFRSRRTAGGSRPGRPVPGRDRQAPVDQPAGLLRPDRAGHQTNADAGPDFQIINVFGIDAAISSKFRRRPDWNAFGSVALHHVHFGDQRGDVWETDFAAYYARQFQVTSSISELPRLRPAHGSASARRPACRSIRTCSATT